MKHATSIIAALLLVSGAGFGQETAPIVIKPGENLPGAIERARGGSRPAVIELAAGRHELSEVLRLTSADNGLTLRGPDSGTARVVGSQRVVGWKRIDPASAIWQAPLPEGWGDRAVAQVFWNDASLRPSRTPNDGWLETSETLAQSGVCEISIPAGILQPGWAELGDVQVVCLQKWAGFRLPIRAIDMDQSRVTLPLSPPPHRQETRNRFWIENAPEALDAPGEWYADRAAGVLRIIPPAGGTAIEQAEVAIAALPELLRLEGCEGVTLRNVTFAQCGDNFPLPHGEIDSQAASARRGAVQLLSCRGCVIERCAVEQVGGYAVDLGQGSRDCTVSRCELRQLGAGGVRIGETQVSDDPADQVQGHTVADCHVHHYGARYPGAVGLIIFQAADNRLLHNDIHDAPYSGVSVGWTWGYRESPCKGNLVEGNHIHHLGGKILSDLGGVYLLGPQPGTVVRGNWIHDIHCFEYGAWGLYTDEGSTSITLEQNIVVGCEKAGFHQHYGRENIVRGNLLVNCGEGMVRRSREEDHLSFRFTGNVVISDSPSLLHNSFRNGHFEFASNLYFTALPDQASWNGMDWAKWQASGQDRDSRLADPLLVDPAQPQLGFRADSPVQQIGFEMPDVAGIGIRPL